MIRVTSNELAKRLGIDYVVAANLIKYLSIKGIAKKVGTIPTATGKGKPSTIYEIPENINLTV